jgi:2-iminobutanoate/2-iminopropanoate deaminase
MTIRTISVGQSVAAYSHGKVVGPLVFTSGVTSHDPATGVVRGSGIEEQTLFALELLEAILAEAGATLADLVQVQAFLNDIEGDFAGFDAAYKAVVPAPYPPRATVGARLPGYRVELLATAAIPQGGES